MRKEHGLPKTILQPGYARRDKPATLYFAQCLNTGLVKIGLSTNLKQRIYQIQGKHKTKLNILGVIPNSKHKDEWAMQRKFKEDHVEYEWFRPSENLLSAARSAERWKP